MAKPKNLPDAFASVKNCHTDPWREPGH